MDESDIGFRRFRLQLNGTFYDALEYRFYFDFANVRSVKDIWVRYLKNDVLKRFRWGYMKEPFSLEWNTSSQFLPFMERALPVDLLAPARDFGVLYDDTSSDKRFSWHLGAFLVTGSLGDVGEVKDQISEYYGTSICGRLTYLPWYRGDGKDLLHLGLNLRYENEESGAEDTIRYSSRPETYLLNERLIDTGEFEADAIYGLGLEAAKAHGTLTFQAEYIQNFLDAPDVDNPNFWGGYIYAGYFLTGENREYDRERGIFSKVKPNRDLHLRANKGWGAWELGFRVSYVDMNSGKIQGGKEVCYTAGLNWYWNPNTRVMFNFIHTKFEDRGTPPAIDSGRANILQTRFQILF
jgi:phosphate-selective porin OprO/OprP